MDQARNQTHPSYYQLGRVFQWKYDVDASSPWWKKLYFHAIFLPFLRFSWFVIGLVPPHRKEPDGSLSWKEDEGFYFNLDVAHHHAAKYPYGGISIVRVDASEPDETVTDRSYFPNSMARERYAQRLSRLTTEVDLPPVESLQRILKDTQGIVDRFRAARL
jgi:hypothetical protein